MAVLRMTAVALVACRAAGAEPGDPPNGSAGAPPTGWKQLPALATAAGAAAKADGVAIDAVDAWGEPALGCYAVWLTLHGGAHGAPALADQVLAGFQAAGRPRDRARRPRGAHSPGPEVSNVSEVSDVSLGEIVTPAGPDGVLAFAFAMPPYHGRVRAHLGAGRIAAIACFGTQREPAACEAACSRVLQGVR